ncbi:MAG: non-ribosomal peptide synthetase, partial [Verrucomicrobiales bacterium]
LIRARVLPVSENEHHLVITTHHIVCDGWSFEILVNELGPLYSGETLSPAESYRDYVLEERESLASEEFDETKGYWIDQFATLPPALDLPTDHGRPSQKSYHSDSVSHTLDPEVTARMQSFCKKNGYTPYVFLLASYDALLGKLSGQTDLVIGTPVAGQVASGHQHLFGHCVQFLPMRLAFDPSMSVRDHLDSVKRVSLDGLDHQTFTLGHLLKALKGARNASSPSLVSTTFTLEADGKPFRSEVISMEADVTPRTHSAFELSLFVVSSASTCRVMAVYNTDLYEEQTVLRWLEQYENLITNMMTAPLEAPMAEVAMLSQSEKERVLVEWNHSKTGAAPEEPTHVLFEAIAETYPSKRAIVSKLGERTYRELNEQANAFAHHLRAQGVNAQDFVGVYLERSPEMIVALLGVLKAGAAYLPIDPSYPAERIKFMLADTRAPLVITQSSMRAALDDTTRVIEMDQPSWDSSKIENLANQTTREDLAYIIYTSGTTGRPKGTTIPHRGVVRLVRNTNYVDFGPNEVFLQAANISFDASTMELWGPLLNGGTLALLPPHAPSLEDIGSAICEFGVSTLWLTSGLFQLMIDERLDDLKGLKQLLAGGDILSKQHVRTALENLDCRLINGYGPTENTTFTCCHTISLEDCDRVSIPIGPPISNTEVYILDEAQRPVAIGVRGELYIGGDGLATGYLNNPELTQEKFVPHPFSEDCEAVLYRSG